MKKILTALVVASFLGAGLACAEGTDLAATASKPTPVKKVAKAPRHHRMHKKGVAKTAPAAVASPVAAK